MAKVSLSKQFENIITSIGEAADMSKPKRSYNKYGHMEYQSDVHFKGHDHNPLERDFQPRVQRPLQERGRGEGMDPSPLGPRRLGRPQGQARSRLGSREGLAPRGLSLCPAAPESRTGRQQAPPRSHRGDYQPRGKYENLFFFFLRSVRFPHP